MTTSNQEKYDASRKAAAIEKFATEYSENPNLKFMIDNTRYLTPDEIHESMRVTGAFTNSNIEVN